MVAWIVFLTVLRELVRALASPFRLILYLPTRHHWRRRAEAALQATPAKTDHSDMDVLADFAPRGNGPTHVFLSAGEASGEAHAVRLMQSLRGESVRWSCFGGESMTAAGGTLHHPLSEHAVMGLLSVLCSLPFIMRAFARYVRLLREDPPDLVVLVDYPGLHLVMAKAARRRGIPVLHYIAPQYWAWGPWRMRRYRRSVDASLTILPFEPAFFAQVGVRSRYVGHPLLDQLKRNPPDPVRTEELRERPLLCLLPGSRRTEIRLHLPGMVQVAKNLRQQNPELRVVLAHRDSRRTELIRDILDAAEGDFVEHQEGPLGEWLAGARLVLAKSGTGSLEACLHGTPTVVVYKVRGRFSTFFARNFLSVPHFAAANLIAGRRAVPELTFRRDEGWNDVAATASALWADGADRQRCLDGLKEVRRRLGPAGASERVAATVRAFLHRTTDPDPSAKESQP